MVTDLFFETVTLQVREKCRNLNHSCSFNRTGECIFVHGRLNHRGRPVITGTLIESVCSVSGVAFISVGIDDDGSLYALFNINEVTDGNSVESD